MAGELLDLQRGCARAREWVSLRLDGELSELERLLLRRHLARCEGCRAFAESARATAELIRSTPQQTPSRGLVPPQPAPGGRRFRYRLVVLAAAVSVGAAVGSVVALSDDGGGPAGPSTGIDVVLNPPSPPPPTTTVQPPGENV
jgi:ferric-dicitrate binding protein FerR (iron transport regulator)